MRKICNPTNYLEGLLSGRPLERWNWFTMLARHLLPLFVISVLPLLFVGVCMMPFLLTSLKNHLLHTPPELVVFDPTFVMICSLLLVNFIRPRHQLLYLTDQTLKPWAQVATFCYALFYHCYFTSVPVTLLLEPAIRPIPTPSSSFFLLTLFLEPAAYALIYMGVIWYGQSIARHRQQSANEP